MERVPLEVWLIVGRWLTIMDWWRLRRTCKHLTTLLPPRLLPSTKPLWLSEEEMKAHMMNVIIPSVVSVDNNIWNIDSLEAFAHGKTPLLVSPCEELWLCAPGHHYDRFHMNMLKDIEKKRGLSEDQSWDLITMEKESLPYIRYLRCVTCDAVLPGTSNWQQPCEPCTTERIRMDKKRRLEEVGQYEILSFFKPLAKKR